MADWDWVTISALATASGTLVLAAATFASVRSANRAARVAEQAFLMGQRPLVMPSRLDDPPEKLMWSDEHWAHMEGGSGLGRTGGWERLPRDVPAQRRQRHRGPAGMAGQAQADRAHDGAVRSGDVPTATPRPLRAAGNVGFWQAAIRDASDPDHGWLREHIEGRTLFMVELLYSDHEGGQRATGLFTLAPGESHHWICSVVQHWNLDRPNPR